MAILDPQSDELGTDVAHLVDLRPVWGLASGKINLACAYVRRLSTPSDGLFYAPGYGFYLPGYISAKWNESIASYVKGRLVAQAKADPRIKDAEVTLVFSFATKTLTARIMLLTADGPFDLVIAATSLTVQLLEVDGVQTVTAPAAAAAANLVLLKGYPGDAGPPGADGSSGTPQMVLDFGDAIGVAGADGTTNEAVLFQRVVRFGDLPGSLVVAIASEILSQSGTSTFRVRVGGSSLTADGTVALTITTASASFTIGSASAAFTNPTGNLYVKVTGQNAVGGQEAWMRGCLVSFR